MTKYGMILLIFFITLIHHSIAFFGCVTAHSDDNNNPVRSIINRLLSIYNRFIIIAAEANAVRVRWRNIVSYESM